MTLYEMDRLCAEKVMGMHLACGVWIGSNGLSTDYNVEQYGNPFEPTRNIAHAWELLYKIGHCYRVQFRMGSHECWIYDQVDYYTQRNIAGGEGETAPLAIVRACLKAKGVDI